MITVFTPSFADENDTNAQNLTVKEIVARLPADKFRVVMFYECSPDPRISGRPNTELLRWAPRGNTLRMLWRVLSNVPDIYFFPREGPFDAAVFASKKYLRIKTAIVTYVVSGGLQQGIPRQTMARNIYDSQVVVANSRLIAEIVDRKLRAVGRVSAVHTIYDGVDERYYYPRAQRSAEEQKLVVFTACSFRVYKRMDMVVKQAAKWPEVNFRIAGTGEEEKRCRLLAQELGCQNLSFLGHLSQQALGEEMRRADIFFFPSELEGQPQVLAQAAASGLPCVARSSYRPEFVLDGVTGFLSASDEDLSNKLDLLLRNRELRHSMSQAAVAHIRTFTWERAACDWARLFEQVLDTRHRAQG